MFHVEPQSSPVPPGRHGPWILGTRLTLVPRCGLSCLARDGAWWPILATPLAISSLLSATYGLGLLTDATVTRALAETALLASWVGAAWAARTIARVAPLVRSQPPGTILIGETLLAAGAQLVLVPPIYLATIALGVEGLDPALGLGGAALSTLASVVFSRASAAHGATLAFLTLWLGSSAFAWNLP